MDEFYSPLYIHNFIEYSPYGPEPQVDLRFAESRLEFLRRKSQHRAKRVVSRYDSTASELLSKLDKFEKGRKRFHLRRYYKIRENAVNYVFGYFYELGIIEKTENLEFGEGLVGNLKGRHDLWSREKLLRITEKDLEKVMRNEPVSIEYDAYSLGMQCVDADPHVNRTYRRELAFVRAREIISPNDEAAVEFVDTLDIFESNVHWIHAPGFKRRCSLAIKNAVGYLESLGIIKTDEVEAAFGQGLTAVLRAKIDKWFEIEIEKNTGYEYERR